MRIKWQGHACFYVTGNNVCVVTDPYTPQLAGLAPLRERDVASMVCCLRGARLLTGYRGCAAVSLPKLTAALLAFSELVTAIAERIDSIDLNPVFCTPERCAVADARIVLAPAP